MPGSYADHWPLDPDVVFLNHGSFGACPIPVLKAQHALRLEMESQPVRFLWRQLRDRLAAAREALARFIGAPADDLAFVPNATAGVNAVLRSLTFESGDELIVTNHEYNACRNALNFVADRSGATVIVVDIPFPIDSPEQVTQCILDHVTPRTRLVLIDHVTSPTALVFPIADITAALQERGVDVLIDGAHAPGMIPLDIESLGAAYYAGNCHKWLCAPKGSGFLHVRPDKQDTIRPIAISHGANAPTDEFSRFRLEFDWTGTFDPTACLSIPNAIEFMASLATDVMHRNRSLALQARDMICHALDVAPPCPDEMIGSMAAVPLPWDTTGLGRWFPSALPLQDELIEQYHIEVPIIPFPIQPNQLVRVSTQIYNTPDHCQQLADALAALRPAR